MPAESVETFRKPKLMNVILSDLIAPSELQSLRDEYARAHRHYKTWTHIEALMTAAARRHCPRRIKLMVPPFVKSMQFTLAFYIDEDARSS